MTDRYFTVLEAGFLAEAPHNWVKGSASVRLRPKNRRYEWINLSLADVLHVRTTYRLAPISESERFRLYLSRSEMTPDGLRIWSDHAIREAADDEELSRRLLLLEAIKAIADDHEKRRPLVKGSCHSIHVVADHVTAQGVDSALTHFPSLTAELAEAAVQYALIYPKKGPSGTETKRLFRSILLDDVVRPDANQ